MKKLLTLALLLTLVSQVGVFAQNSIPPHIKNNITYPLLDFTPWIGVMPIENPAMPYNPDIENKIAIDIYGSVKDSTAIQSAFSEIARTFNLHVANGVPADKIQIAAVVHGGMTRAAFTDEAYMEKYGIENPNTLAIKELEKVGVKFYLCGQSMSFLNIPRDKITPEVKVAISAKTTFVALDQMGFTYMNVSEN